MNIPWALYRIAAFDLLLGSEYEWDCLETLCQAIRRSSVAFHLDSAIEAARAMAAVEPLRRDVKCAERLLWVARRARFPGTPFPGALHVAGKPISGPVVIVAGGCDPAHQEEMATYREMLHDTFADFAGTVISGGTLEGISGLIGELGRLPKGASDTIGYLPSTLPADGTAHRDERYNDLRNTDGERAFSALEPLQNWIDLLASGMSPQEVRVLGINGGKIAEFEYRLAWAFGAQVAVVRDSGRVADKIEGDVQAEEFEGMLIVPKDVLTLRAFLYGDNPKPLPFTSQQHERLARLTHAKFLEQNRHRHPDRAMRPWEQLDEDFRVSNLDQVAYMAQTLHAAGYDVVSADGIVPPIQFTTEEVEFMSRMEHGRWNLERIRSGWRYDAQRERSQKAQPLLGELGPAARTRHATGTVASLMISRDSSPKQDSKSCGVQSEKELAEPSKARFDVVQEEECTSNPALKSIKAMVSLTGCADSRSADARTRLTDGLFGF